MPMHHVNLTDTQSGLLKQMVTKIGVNQSAVVALALRALEDREVLRDREVRG